MTKRHGYALVAALAAVVVLISTAIYVAFSGGDRHDTTLGAGPSAQGSADPAAAGSWVGTWATAPAGAEPRTGAGFAGRTLRNVVHTSVGGTHARITLSNLFGTQPLTIGHASIAQASAPSNPTARPDSLRRLTFGGKPQVVIPAGGQVTSDPARLAVPADADLLVSTYAPTPSGPVTYHPHARQISFVANGDQTQNPRGDGYTEQSPYWRYLTAVDVLTREATGSVAILGDSLTDGVTSTLGANARWPDVLADRLREEAGAPRLGVLNEGISGNQLVPGGQFPPAGPSGVSRFERDVLSRTGVRSVVVVLGVNDLLRNPRHADADQLLDAMRELTRQAHARGLRVTGATLMPFNGHRGYRPHLDQLRRTINAEIRSGRVFDHVVDFDRALRDPYAPDRLRELYDSGDHLHPSDAGYRKMAESFNLSHLRGSAPAQL
ncbi:SGNH/GDSL hydrolase family protein [Streptomyces sp. TRM66268-LWL]|uniref:SGNH/GDSL hydrolase family protein n=1 Tax=Streptomyces polyasparticus TaxID=2767826 RepID=A0ABR7SNW2_9ACTN|nr:SGNH/GDSL hydrolase family protein [Streptomyces polyasparticus]MBC9717108.1 SGNH/GDSL hydrolase family protein [Streptomyces polyasparticus]